VGHASLGAKLRIKAAYNAVYGLKVTELVRKVEMFQGCLNQLVSELHCEPELPQVKTYGKRQQRKKLLAAPCARWGASQAVPMHSLGYHTIQLADPKVTIGNLVYRLKRDLVTGVFEF